MKIFTEKKFRKHEFDKNVTINDLRYNINCYSRYVNFLEDKQEEIRDMLYELLELRKTNISKSAIFTKVKKIINQIERGTYSG